MTTQEKQVLRIGGLEIKTTADIVDEGIFYTFYGQAGSGKTTLAASASLSELGRPYMHIDAEGGMEAIKHMKDIEFVELFQWQQFVSLIEALKKGQHEYKSFCFDNMVEIINLCVNSITGNADDSVEIQEWGKVKRQVIHRVRELRDIARTQGVNIFVCAWDETDDKNTRKDIAFTPALKKEYPGQVTAIGHIDVLNDPEKRMLNFAPNPKNINKFRRAGDARAKKIPFKIAYGLDRLPLPDILDVIKGGSEWPESKYPKTAQFAASD